MGALVPESLLDELGTAVGERIRGVRDLIGNGGARLSGAATLTVPAIPQGSLDHVQTVAALGVLPTLIIMAALAPHDDTDENHELWLDPMLLTARAGIDEITINATFSAPTSGSIKLNWSVL
jgi:hypothetical protein